MTSFSRAVRILLVATLLILVVLCGFLIREFETLQHQHLVPDESQLMRGRVMTQTNPDFIQPWMTFDYIDLVYGLPPTYLQNALSIGSLSYPRLSISQAATAQGVSTDAFLGQVKSAVRAYQQVP